MSQFVCHYYLMLSSTMQPKIKYLAVNSEICEETMNFSKDSFEIYASKTVSATGLGKAISVNNS